MVISNFFNRVSPSSRPAYSSSGCYSLQFPQLSASFNFYSNTSIFAMATAVARAQDSLFAMTVQQTYVALSRSRGRNTIRLLRDFDEDLFQHPPSEALRLDMERLEALNRVTKERWENRDAV
jgi:hypothetical protein